MTYILIKFQYFLVHELSSKQVKFLWKRKHFEERSWKRKRTRKHLTFDEPEAEAFFIKHEVGVWKRKLEAEAVKAVNFYGSGNRSTLKKKAGSGSKLGSD